MGQPLLEMVAGQLRFRIDVAEQTHDQLLQTADQLLHLHAQATTLYQEARAAAAPTVGSEQERVYMHYLEWWCELLIQHASPALAPFIAAVPIALLTDPHHRHLVEYYRGLGEGLLERYEEARAVLAALLGAPELDAVVRGRALNSAAVFARYVGDYQGAISGYTASLVIWRQLGNQSREGLALMNQGVLHYFLQDYAAATRDLQASLPMLEAAGTAHAQGLAHMNLGLLARDQGRWDDALVHATHAQARFQQAGARDFLGRVANNVGEIAMLRGQFDLAMAQFEQALQQMTARTYRVDVWLNLGLVNQARGDDVTALGHYRSALEQALAVGRNEIVGLIHYRIGHALERLNQLDAAQGSYAAAITMIEGTRRPIRDQGLLISLMGRWQQVYEAALLLCLARGDAAGAFHYAERARARAFADLLAQQGSAVPQGDVVPVTGTEAQQLLGDDPLLVVFFCTGLRGPEAVLLDAMPPSAAGLRACLDMPAQLIVWAINRTQFTAQPCSIDPHLLQGASRFTADGRRFLSEHLLQTLYAALLQPIRDQLSPQKPVVIVPHGPLHQLSFAALRAADNQPLADQVAWLTYAPSATIYLRTVAAVSPPSGCLALGYDRGDGSLRHTEGEAQAVARICQGMALRGHAAIKEQLLAIASQYRWLHFACHGTFDLREPLHSYLELGPDQRLSATEIIEHLRLRAELVTLSACRSGTTRVLRGDEPMGLVRAFLRAGGRAVLMTLWPVEDLGSRLLMERFYTVLQGGGPTVVPAAALHTAQRYLRHLTAGEVRRQLREWGDDPTLIAAPDESYPYADASYWAAYALVATALGR